MAEKPEPLLCSATSRSQRDRDADGFLLSHWILLKVVDLRLLIIQMSLQLLFLIRNTSSALSIKCWVPQGAGKTGHLPQDDNRKFNLLPWVLFSALGRRGEAPESCLTLLTDSCFHLRACLKPPSFFPFFLPPPLFLSPFSLLSSFLSFPFHFFPSTHLLSTY